MDTVSRVTNWSYKSWSNYTGPNVDFGHINIFYGSNGKGKSSLARGIVEEFKKVGPESSLRLFNRYYLQESLFLKDSDTEIKGVRASFGKKHVDIDMQIDALENEKEAVTANKEQCTAAIGKQSERIHAEINKIFTSRKGNTGIKSKSDKEFEQAINAWIKDYQTALKEFPNVDFSLITGDNTAEEELVELKSLDEFSVSIPEGNDIADAVLLCKREFDELDIPSSTVLSWIESGLKLHEDSDKVCKFCGGSIELKEVRSKLEEYQKTETTLAEKKLQELISITEQLIQQCKKAVESRKRFDAILHSEQVLIACKSLDELSTELQKTSENILSEKILDMNVGIDFDGEAYSVLVSAVKESLDYIDQSVNEAEQDAQARIDKLSMLVKGAIGFEVSNNTLIQQLTHEVTVVKEEESRLASREKSINLEIQTLQQSKSDISDFKMLLNEILLSLEMPFTLVTSGENYYLCIEDEQSQLSVHDISEGERNLLGLLFFYYELFEDDKQNEPKPDVELVIVDDPTSSMDSSNRFLVLEIIRSLFRQEWQVFVFTHEWEGFCDLVYGRSADIGKFEIGKHNGQSSIQPCNSSLMPYKKLFQEIYQFSQLQINDPQLDDLSLHMPNTMRRVLEEYLRFNTRVERVSAATEQGIGEMLFIGENWNNAVSEQNKAKVRQLISITNALSHRVPDSYNSSDIQMSARFLMSRIKKINRCHYNAMKTD
jgi:wobble nucleotide-excising tRNase